MAWSIVACWTPETLVLTRLRALLSRPLNTMIFGTLCQTAACDDELSKSVDIAFSGDIVTQVHKKQSATCTTFKICLWRPSYSQCHASNILCVCIMCAGIDMHNEAKSNFCVMCKQHHLEFCLNGRDLIKRSHWARGQVPRTAWSETWNHSVRSMTCEYLPKQRGCQISTSWRNPWLKISSGQLKWTIVPGIEIVRAYFYCIRANHWMAVM